MGTHPKLIGPIMKLAVVSLFVGLACSGVSAKTLVFSDQKLIQEDDNPTYDICNGCQFFNAELMYTTQIINLHKGPFDPVPEVDDGLGGQGEDGEYVPSEADLGYSIGGTCNGCQMFNAKTMNLTNVINMAKPKDDAELEAILSSGFSNELFETQSAVPAPNAAVMDVRICTNC